MKNELPISFKSNKTKKSNVIQNVSKENKMYKYYIKRNFLWSKYKKGIWMDLESWYSVTPEIIAKHISKRVHNKIILDAFGGTGGNSIQFALNNNFVIYNELDNVKVKCAKHNSVIYNVNDKITFINGNYFDIIKFKLKCNVIFLGPPWNGPAYQDCGEFSYSLYDDMGGNNGFEIFKLAKKITNNIIYLLPKNTNPEHISLLLENENEECEIEYNYTNGLLKTMTLYFGDLIKRDNPIYKYSNFDVNQFIKCYKY